MAAEASPTKPAAANVALRSSFKLTTPRKSGNTIADEQNRAVYADLEDLIDHCCEHPEDTSILRRKCKELQSDRIKRADDGISELFVHFGTVSQLDSVVILAWLLKHSDLTVDDLQRIKKQDGQGLHQLYSHATQLSLSLKLPDDLRNVEVFNLFSAARAAIMGEKLKHFKRGGGVSASGTLDFNDRLVQITWDTNEVLKEIKHNTSGKMSELPKGTHITKEYEFQSFWFEADAKVKIGCLPPIKLLQLFGKDPDFGYPLGANGKKHLTALAAAVKPFTEQYNAKVKEVVGSKSESSNNQRTEILQVLGDVAKEKRLESAAGAKEKALKSLALTAKKRKLSLTASPGNQES